MTELLEAPGQVQPRLPVWAPLAAAGAALGLGWTSCVWAGTHVHPDPVLHDAALFVHLVSLVLGFGAVLSVDWVALLWLAGRRRLSDVLVAAGNVNLLIWVGYAGLVLSGVLLEPQLASPLTQVKLGLVLLIGWNGLVASWLHHRLHGAPMGRGLFMVSGCSASLSQLGWWGAMAIGFLNAR